MATEKRRRQHGTGTVYQRADGRWIGRYRNGYTASGSVAYKSVSATTEKACKAALNKALLDRNREADEGIDPKMTVKRWLDIWLPIRKTKVRPKTFSDDQSSARRWIIPAVGGRRLVDLSPADFRKLTTSIQKGKPGKTPPGQSTVRRAHEVLITALKAAALEGHTVPSRLFLIKPPAKDASDRTAIPVDEALLILKAAEAMPDRSRWVAALLNGVRQGECLGLTWDRVDLEAGVVDVSWQQQELVYEHRCQGEDGMITCGKKRGASCPDRGFRIPDGFESRQMQGRWHWTRPKTKSGTRLLPLVPWMVTALRQWQKDAPASPLGLVWPAADGRVRESGDDLAAFHALQEAAGVAHPSGRYYHLHEARHATATLLLALGVDTPVIVALMGHSSILSTRAYQHTDLAMMRAALDGVAERLQLSA